MGFGGLRKIDTPREIQPLDLRNLSAKLKVGTWHHAQENEGQIGVRMTSIGSKQNTGSNEQRVGVQSNRRGAYSHLE